MLAKNSEDMISAMVVAAEHATVVFHFNIFLQRHAGEGDLEEIVDRGTHDGTTGIDCCSKASPCAEQQEMCGDAFVLHGLIVHACR